MYVENINETKNSSNDKCPSKQTKPNEQISRANQVRYKMCLLFNIGVYFSGSALLSNITVWAITNPVNIGRQIAKHMDAASRK